MNPSGIEWVDRVWNPVTGCLNGCTYCWAERLATRLSGVKNQDKYRPKGYDTSRKGPFSPRVHMAEFEPGKVPASVKKPCKVLVVSMGDLWGDWMGRETVQRVLSECRRGDVEHHTFLFLTKNPGRYSEVLCGWGEVPSNWWFGTSLDCKNFGHEQLRGLVTGWRGKEPNLYASFEPLIAEPSIETIEAIKHLDWLIVGAKSCPGPVDPEQPEPGWVRGLVDEADGEDIPVFLKDNLDCEALGVAERQRFPEKMR